ncbi:MAG: hypothetical protein KOO62_06820 [candidate division Zixibacteria bacterium]|nr:hypothetical protein [candidate division Zixibacteria bacterium]
MYAIEKTEYGIHLTFGGTIPGEEMANWVREFRVVVDSIKSDYMVFVDMRDLKTLSKFAQDQMKVGQTLAREGGMVRSVVILADPKIKMQFVGIAKETGIYEWERYIDSSTEADWEEKGMLWIVGAVDPDSSKHNSESQRIFISGIK